MPSNIVKTWEGIRLPERLDEYCVEHVDCDTCPFYNTNILRRVCTLVDELDAAMNMVSEKLKAERDG